MHWMYEYFVASTAELNSPCRNDAFVSMQLWCIFFFVCASVFIVYFLTVLQLLWTFDIKILRNPCWLFLLSVSALPHECHLCSCHEWTDLHLHYSSDADCLILLPFTPPVKRSTCSFTPGLSESSFAWLHVNNVSFHWSPAEPRESKITNSQV